MYLSKARQQLTVIKKVSDVEDSKKGFLQQRQSAAQKTFFSIGFELFYSAST